MSKDSLVVPQVDVRLGLRRKLVWGVLVGIIEQVYPRTCAIVRRAQGLHLSASLR